MGGFFIQQKKKIKPRQGTRNVGDMTSVEIDEYIAFCSEVLGNESRLSTCIESRKRTNYTMD